MTDNPPARPAPKGVASKSFTIAGAELAARPLDAALYLVSTPIGNLGDMTLRGLETLAAADVIACEDTRVSRVLLERYGIAGRPYAYHEHNADAVGPKLIARICGGESVALISDAGTPLVSDPGYRLTQLALDAGLRVIPVPGASAPLAALVASGLPNDAFLFGGFLPQKDKAKRDRLRAFADVAATLVFFDSPNRIGATLQAAAEELGATRPAAVCRELTKAFEEVRRDTLGGLAEAYADTTTKGEIVLVIAPGEYSPPSAQEVDSILAELITDLPAGKAATEASHRTGLPRKVLYDRLLAMKDER
ncbi:16S rRNA (cytidine(1402)-2'-O)-methyltransferase [Pseudohoeflea coraliihabitans]|uniref:Ribosomal RNA small subunit methyltransferase I n=1 Tax=Pseudohoeflea coraliihabitans TaxID=2860393 RepID=A0ABS6WNS2_9HYPH|nr:16S rRNA (cytidine(1402)-2'-O)-methyltransferase [Pseudohoeflea sp. DP4N28-3]MBW3097614.1 16S rRNA (cytidine(1402)-2'-O)-methyltransferase [Pseudohoeflea sp. DP4N28-3]